jgi:hypothetical protein
MKKNNKWKKKYKINNYQSTYSIPIINLNLVTINDGVFLSYLNIV